MRTGVYDAVCGEVCDIDCDVVYSVVCDAV